MHGVFHDHRSGHVLLGVAEAEIEVTAETVATADQDPLSEEAEAQFLMTDLGVLSPPRQGSIADLLMAAHRREVTHLLVMIDWPQPVMGLTTVMVLERRVEAQQGTAMIGTMTAPKLMVAAAALGMTIGAPLMMMMTTAISRPHLKEYFPDK